MKRSAFAAFLLSLFLTTAPGLASAADGWYGALDLGRSHFSGLVGEDGPFPASFFNPYNLDQSDTAYRLAAGYQFNPYLGVEAGYTDLGKAEQSVTQTMFSDPGVPPVTNTRANEVKVHGYLAEVIGTLPLVSDWWLFARAGGFISHVENDNITPGVINPGVVNTSFSYNHSALTYGVGVGWSYSEKLKFRLGWDDYGTLGNAGSVGATGKFRASVLALSIAYSFQ